MRCKRVPPLPRRLSIGFFFLCIVLMNVSVSAQTSSISADSLWASLPSLADQRVLGDIRALDSVQLALPPAEKKAKPFKFHGNKKYDPSKIGHRGIGKGVNFYSLDKEQAMGRELAQEVERQAKLLKDPVINEYINRVGQNLVLHSDAKVPFTIKVIDSDEVNAFALPGGYFYVDTGLILAADSEAELAGVMAHEIAHVAARHATRNMTKSDLFQIASVPLIFAGGPVGYAVGQAAGLALPMGFLKFSRDAEREADLLGMEYAYSAGYDPQSFVDFFEKLEAQEKHKPGFVAKAFSTHPMTADRVKAAQREMDTMLPPRKQYIVDTSEFEHVKARLAQLENRRRLDVKKPDRPTLRRAESGKVDGGSSSTASNDDQRPTLKRPNSN
jgi:predicted Zn-dependent protease